MTLDALPLAQAWATSLLVCFCLIGELQSQTRTGPIPTIAYRDLVANADDDGAKEAKQALIAALNNVGRLYAANPKELRELMGLKNDRTGNWLLNNSELDSVESLRAVHQSLRRNIAGLEKPQFKKLRQALRDYADLLDVRSEADADKKHNETIKELERWLSKLNGKLTAHDYFLLCGKYEQIARHRQASVLAGRLRQKCSRPNLKIVIPQAIMTKVMNYKIDEPFNYRGMVGAASVQGRGRLSGTVRTSLMSRESYGAMDVGISGQSVSDTVSYERNVWINTHNTLKYQSKTVVKLAAEGITVSKPQTKGTLSNPITGTSTSLRRRNAATAIAEARSQHSQRHGLAQAQALRDLNDGLTTALHKHIGELDRSYQTNVRLPLLRADLFPTNVSIKSKPESLTLTAICADSRQLATDNDPPATANNDLIQVVCHQTAINNSSIALAGSTQSLTQTLKSLFPAFSSSNSQGNSLKLTFSYTNPIQVCFDANKVLVVFQGSRYSYRHQGKNVDVPEDIAISLRYGLKKAGKEWKLVLAGAPSIDLAATGVRSVAQRRVLTNILGERLPKEITLGRLPAPSLYPQIGSLDLHEIKFDKGWLILGLKPTS